MFRIQAKLTPSIWEAITVLVLIILTMTISIIKFNAQPHIPVIISILLLMIYGVIKKVSYKDLEKGMVEGAYAGLGAAFIFFFIGILISALLISGSIPTLIYYGFEAISPRFFYAIIFVIACIVGVAIGSSLTTTATVGVAFIGMASAMDLSLAITAGAVVSGAFFGDKMSPLSDTTNLASAIMDVDLFEHIKNLCWTTIPAFIISFIIYIFLSPSTSANNLNGIQKFQEGLLQTDLVHWYAFIPLVALVILALYKVPAIPTLAITSAVAIAIAYIPSSYNGTQLFEILFKGYTSETGMAAVDTLLTRGGVSSMFFTIGLVLLALSMGGLLFTLGIIQTLLRKIEQALNSTGSVITGAALTAIGVNTFVGEQYLSILLTGETFKEQFKKVGLKSKNLARTAEDAGTVVNPLIPWSVCGIFITTVLGVSTLEYLPFAFFCLLSPILTIIFGWSGKTLSYIEK